MQADPPAAATAPALSLVHVSKRFGAVQALRDASFDIAPGEVFGYLGPNGAGKTTTLRVVLGLVHTDAGTVTILGQPAPRRASGSDSSRATSPSTLS